MVFLQVLEDIIITFGGTQTLTENPSVCMHSVVTSVCAYMVNMGIPS